MNCLEEDHVSHGITIQEPRPRPMKETLHSRHHSTVLPRLGSSRMESHQNLHTHAVDSAIQLQGHNRVLKKRPPPISDEKQRLNRRQRCTLSLSQLRSGHCNLLQDYKHRVLGEPSDICTQTVELHHKMRDICSLTPHTQLTCHQRIFGRIRSDQFVRLAISTTETLTDLTTDLVMANNNNMGKHKCFSFHAISIRNYMIRYVPINIPYT